MIKLRSFCVCSKMLKIFCMSMVEHEIPSAVGVATSEPVTSKMKLNKLIKKAGSVLGTVLEHLRLVAQRRMLHKMKHSSF